MPINTNALQRLLCERLCEDVQLTERPDGATTTILTRFWKVRGESCWSASSARLESSGMAVRSMWMLLSNGCLRAIFRFGQALTRIHDLTFLSRSRVRSTFYDDLADFLKSRIDEDKIKADYLPEGLPNPEAYPVDYRIEGRYDRPLFLYGIPNRDKARLTTIILSHFHRNNLKFDSILVFEDQAEIPRLDLARLSDVGGEMVSSLESAVDLERKILSRVSA